MKNVPTDFQQNKIVTNVITENDFFFSVYNKTVDIFQSHIRRSPSNMASDILIADDLSFEVHSYWSRSNGDVKIKKETAV